MAHIPEGESEDFDLEFLDNELNDDDVLEFANYKRLTKPQLKQILAYLSENVPDWQSQHRAELAELVPTILGSQGGHQKGSPVRVVNERRSIKLKCPHCLQTLETESDMLGQEISCPKCNETFTLQEDDLVNRPAQTKQRPRGRGFQVPTASRRKKTVFAGTGALLELIGFLALFFYFPVGVFAGIILIAIGFQMSRKWVCDFCGNRLDSGNVQICPTCKRVLK